ncbi:MAG TPA: hypothetical protein VHP80_07165 [Candidatus Acidoferrum sp.]|jgi:hypothetical protein|nr:hypothetical protein [Candidatus Acidoferrum sp.]
MGQERESTLRIAKKRIEGEALLETAEIIFRPIDGSKRLKFAFADISKSVKAIDGELRFHTEEGPAVLELGAAAEKWAEKILHPKSRAQKLGVKSGMKLAVVGSFDTDFQKELRAIAKNISDGNIVEESELIFMALESVKDLNGVAKVAKSVKGAAGLWIVYPKGKKDITENDVIGAGRKTGLKDVKVVGFSRTHTALKFVLPLEKR